MKEDQKQEAAEFLAAIDATKTEDVKEVLEEKEPGIGHVMVPESRRRRPRNTVAESAYTKRWADTLAERRKKRKISKASRRKNRKNRKNRRK